MWEKSKCENDSRPPETSAEALTILSLLSADTRDFKWVAAVVVTTAENGIGRFSCLRSADGGKFKKKKKTTRRCGTVLLNELF